MNNFYIDFESYFDKNYTLKKLRTIEYVRDSRFMCHGAAVICEELFGDTEPRWLTRPALEITLDRLQQRQNQGEQVRVIAHKTYFDGLILTQQFRFFADEYHCTLSMARALLPNGHEYDNDLDNVAKLLGFKGKRNQRALADIKGETCLTQEQWNNLGVYGKGDVEDCYHIHRKLLPAMPPEEVEMMHIVLRCGIEPVLQLDKPLLEEAFKELEQEREALIAASGYTAKQLGSNKQFAAILESLDIPVPKKISKTTGKLTEAFGKTDLGFKALIADYPQYNHLFKARIAVKGNNAIKRAEAMINIAGPLGIETFPMPLKYSGAHTHRLSGDDRLNVQNLNRGSKLRLAILAALGYDIAVADLSGIELRVNHYLGDEHGTLELIRLGGDVYSDTASKHFGYPVNKKMEERQFGKMQELALGFGMGPPTFKYNAAVGFMGCPETFLTDAQAYQAVHGWRHNKPGIVSFWKFLESMLPQMTRKECDVPFKCIRFVHEAVILPGGLMLSYPNLRCTEDGWVYGYKVTKKIYGGLFCENIVQAVARMIIAEQMVAIEKIPGVRTVSMTHDEDIVLIPKGRNDIYNQMIIIMSQSPEWAPDLPLDAEGGYAHNYSK